MRWECRNNFEFGRGDDTASPSLFETARFQSQNHVMDACLRMICTWRSSRKECWRNEVVVEERKCGQSRFTSEIHHIVHSPGTISGLHSHRHHTAEHANLCLARSAKFNFFQEIRHEKSEFKLDIVKYVAWCERT